MKITPELLDLYARKECTAKERDSIEEWLQQNKDNGKKLSQGFIEAEQKLIWNNITDAIDLQKERTVILIANTLFWKKSKTWIAAASILLIVGLSIVDYLVNL